MAASMCASLPGNLRLPVIRPPLSSPLPLRSAVCRAGQYNLYSHRLSHSPLVIIAQKSPDFYKAFSVTVKTARDVLEAGTKLVPESVPRPLAQAGVALVGIVGTLYLLQSLFSIALFILFIGGVGYYLFYSFNKDDDDQRGGGRSSSSSDTDLTLEEARRIMEKYK
ncbi:hypothetical protein KP509_04G044100 [Ceratopteris richardii]|uniref:Uncharacterized protein n=1 Tax=Ceratopteris richardii TaxID=49495 RepID=A0A8T2UZW6_CERRI|nr:hypothetical protein KP509_04G044100 [Ceratopteris richardii]